MLASCEKDDGANHIISDFSPRETGYGDTITITGKNFSTNPAENIVTFNGVEATVILAYKYTNAPTTVLKVIVPKNPQCSGAVRVTVGGKTAVSKDNFTYVRTSTVSTITNTAGNSVIVEHPNGIAIDVAGNIYVAEEGHRIEKIISTGEVIAIAGDKMIPGFANGLGTTALFKNPYDIAIDISGNLYVADYGNNRIRKITPECEVSTFAGNGNYGLVDGAREIAQFNFPMGVTIDAAGNLYVTDYGNHCIRKITPEGVVSTFAGNGFQGFTNGAGTLAKFNSPKGIAIDALGNLYVADNNNYCIRKITPAGVVSTLAGNGTMGFNDGAGATAQFYSLGGITVDASGNVYVVDNNRIRKITSAGVVTTIAGKEDKGSFADGAGAVARFSSPRGLAVDALGNIYVADFGNNCIRKIEIEKD